MAEMGLHLVVRGHLLSNSRLAIGSCGKENLDVNRTLNQSKIWNLCYVKHNSSYLRRSQRCV